ncbi:MAG: sulfatase-like hydrolase/transferase [Verrucomicrobiota bacterium]
MKPRISFLSQASLSLSALFLFAIHLHAAEKPNFILLLSDDQSWNGLSVAMHPDIAWSKSSAFDTPNLEKFAAQGMRFSAAYSPSGVCSPTRISLQTGISPGQLRFTKAAPVATARDGLKLIPPVSRKQIDNDETTIPELLKTVGYATAHYGKWHLGNGGPEAHGYDESDGNTGNGDAYGHTDNNPADVFGMGQRASAFMEKCDAAGLPFFVQMAYYPLHAPESASKEAVDHFQSRNSRVNQRAPIAWDLDRGVGFLLEEIERLGLAESTYIIYMGDNGGGGGGDKGARRRGGAAASGSLKGGKGSSWEGGIRVPFILRGPGVPANSWCHDRVVGFDLLPTFCQMAGVTRQLPDKVEGGDISHLFHGETGPVQRPREELVFHFPHYQNGGPHSAIFRGDDKLIRFFEDDSIKLFDISKDISESTDLSSREPEKAQQLNDRLTAYLEEVDAALPQPNPDHVPGSVYVEKKGGKGGAKGGGKGKGKGRKGERN